MIIVNGPPKSGTTLLATYLQACGLMLEPGGLMAYPGRAMLVMRGGGPWGAVRSLPEVLGHFEQDRVIGAHAGDHISFPGHKVVFTYRNPRNMLVSLARWRCVKLDWTNVTEQPSREQVFARIDEALIAEVLDNMRDFHGWLTKADIAIRFVDFVEKPFLMAARLGTALGIKPADPTEILGDNAPWVTEAYRGTWSGRHSDWREIWNDELDEGWRLQGGHEVEQAYGFDL